MYINIINNERDNKMINIITGISKKPMASKELTEFFENSNYDGHLYIGYPIIGTVDGAYPIDAIWISKEYGLTIFDLIENKNIVDYQETQDDHANKMESKLRGHKELVEKRNLCVNINVVTFAPFLTNEEINKHSEDDYPLVNKNSINNCFENFKWEKSEYYEKVVSVLQSISTIRKGTKKRIISNESSKGAKLKSLEDSIANLDNRQSKAVIETVDGVQRIRGLAGSGKTVILALKAAYLHAQHPEWKIAVTFNTRSLKGQFKKLINTFYIEQANDEPNWENLKIIHAWGAPGGGEKNGLYYEFCLENNIEYNDYLTSKNKFNTADPFGKVCEKALSDAKSKIQEIYDVILVDEAQDFSANFLKLCYEMLRYPKRLVYAYDELQNLKSQSLPSPEEIFGTDSNGIPKVQFSEEMEGIAQRDIILKKCYRNSRPTLVTAHALGFGIYREQKLDGQSPLVQMFEQNSLWEEIGYKVINGNLRDNSHVILSRPEESSPRFLEQHSSIDELIQFKSFNTEEEQNNWVAEQISYNLREEELRHDDIIVINPDPRTTRIAVAPIRAKLFKKSINSHTAGVDTTPDIFFNPDLESIAFTGIYRAKGNEAAMVYIINAESCYESSYELAKKRNQLFTAITRSKAWVRVLGVGENMNKLLEEYNEVKRKNFTLDFVYPNKEQREKMNLINRDMSTAERAKIEKSKLDLSSLLRDLEEGNLYVEDLGKDQVDRLIALINKDRRI